MPPISPPGSLSSIYTTEFTGGTTVLTSIFLFAAADCYNFYIDPHVFLIRRSLGCKPLTAFQVLWKPAMDIHDWNSIEGRKWHVYLDMVVNLPS